MEVIIIVKGWGGGGDLEWERDGLQGCRSVIIRYPHTFGLIVYTEPYKTGFLYEQGFQIEPLRKEEPFPSHLRNP